MPFTQPIALTRLGARSLDRTDFRSIFGPMLQSLTVSEAKPILGRLLDNVVKGRAVYLRRKNHLFRIEAVEVPEPIPVRPVGYFDFGAKDELTALANRSAVSFTAPDED